MVFRVLVITAVLLAGVLLWDYLPSQTDSPQQTPEKQLEEEEVSLPTFDTVRIDADGAAVLAGRSKPFALISLLHGENLVGNAHASARGEWVIILEQPLALDNPSYLRIRAKHRNGKIYLSEQIITIGALRNKAKPYVVLAKPKAGSSMLQSNGKQSDIVLEVIDYDDTGAAIFSGKARANARIRLYYRNKFVGETTSGIDDKWQIRAQGLQEGIGQLRLDFLNNEGKVTARIELPFKMEKNLNQAKGKVIIQAGDSLWKLARNLYGKGVLYTIIYEHNQDNIKNPNLIYPGQVFETPKQ